MTNIIKSSKFKERCFKIELIESKIQISEMIFIARVSLTNT